MDPQNQDEKVIGGSTGTGFHGSPTLQVNAETGKQKTNIPR